MIALRSTLEKNLGWFILILLALGCVFVMRPFFLALLWAGILTFSSWPLYNRLLNRMNGRNTLSALIMTCCLAVVILLPLTIIGFTVADQGKELLIAAKKWIDSGPPSTPEWLRRLPLIGSRFETADSEKVLALLRRLIEPATAHVVGVGLAIAGGLVRVALSLFICFFLFRNGAATAQRLSAGVTRIGGARGEYLLNLAGMTVRGVVYGVLGTALIQAVLAGIGFLIAGVPGAAVLALITLFVSLLPMGPPLVCIAPAFWLYHQGSTGWAVFIMVWGFAVGSIDNFLKPWLISRGGATPFLVILFGVLGGAIAFGFIGVFLGPTLLAVGYRIVQEWFAQKPVSEDVSPLPETPEPIPALATVDFLRHN
ncbi:MAG TPA: AI-2E family transporter [Verrucomicrobiae bacterium]